MTRRNFTDLALRAVQALSLLAGVWACALTIGYLLHTTEVARHQVESAVTAFVVLGILSRLRGHADEAVDARVVHAWHRTPVWWCALALVLYWPSLWVGWLSDDFVLVARAQQGAIGAVHADLFRPLVLAIWQLMLSAGWGAPALHALTIGAHGLVAFLTVRLARRAGLTPLFAACAGAIVLTFPASVEAVTWTSGTFDVAATLGVLSAALVALDYGERPSLARRATLLGACVAALLCKETALVTPVLVAVLAWSLALRSRALWVDLSVTTIVFGVVGAIRLALASGAVRQPITRYAVQRWLFGTVGGAAVPWHTDVMRSLPWLAAGVAVVLLILAMAFVARPLSTAQGRRAAAAAAWILVGSAPTLTFFFVGPDLQGSRYLYLPVVGWAMLLATMAGSVGRSGATALVVISLTGWFGVARHQGPWREAAAERDAVLDWARAARARGCAAVAMADLPDVVRGAYVLRNGANEALSTVGVALAAQADPDCMRQPRAVPVDRLREPVDRLP